MEKAKRIGGIDFWRGAVLIAILVDHIPGNVLENFTPRNFGLSDSSEAFVFPLWPVRWVGLSSESAKARDCRKSHAPALSAPRNCTAFTSA